MTAGCVRRAEPSTWTPRSAFNIGQGKAFGRSRGNIAATALDGQAPFFAIPMILNAACLGLAIVFPWALIAPGAYALVIVITSISMALRKRSAYGLVTGPAAVVMHVSWAFGFIQGLLTRRVPIVPVLATFDP